MSRRAWGSVLAVLVIVPAVFTWARLSARPEIEDPMPSARSESSTLTLEPRTFLRTIRLHGVVEARESHTVQAPRLRGAGMNSLVITHIVPSGTSVRRGDLIVEFDRQNQVRDGLDRRAEWRDLEEQINKKRAEHDALKAKDETELQQAESGVEKARLDTLKNRFLPKIEAEKNQQALDAATAKFDALSKGFVLKRRANEAERRILEVRRDRAARAMEHAEVNAERMVVRAPIDGLVVVKSLWRGGQFNEVQEGEELRAGSPVAEVVGPTAMRVSARVNQADLGVLSVGQQALVRLDAAPERTFRATLERLTPIATASQFSALVRTVNAYFTIDDVDPAVMPDLSAAVDVELERRDNVLLVPREAVIQDGESTIVYVRTALGYEAHSVALGRANEIEAVVEDGLETGAVVLRRARER